MIEKRLKPVRLGMLAVAAAGLLVAGCSKGGSDEEKVEANASQQSEVNIPIPTEPAVPAISDVPNTTASAENLVAPADPLSDEQQMIEDAEATGMTSRSSGYAETPSNQPVQDTTGE